VAACTACSTGDECVDGGFGLKACCPNGKSFCGPGPVCCSDNSEFCCANGECCDSPCCEGGTVCCPDGVDCCNDTCCTSGAAHCCDIDGTLECVSVC
jgi:hypothetical protein